MLCEASRANDGDAGKGSRGCFCCIGVARGAELVAVQLPELFEPLHLLVGLNEATLKCEAALLECGARLFARPSKAKVLRLVDNLGFAAAPVK